VITQTEQSRCCPAQTSTLPLADNLGHAIIKDRCACHLVKGVVPPRDAPKLGYAFEWTSANASAAPSVPAACGAPAVLAQRG
jgi:hypothetical protein